MNAASPRLSRGEFIALLAGLGGLAGVAHAQDAPRAQGDDPSAALRYPRAVVLVRHAEKLADGGADPALSEAGVQRAQRLAQMLSHSGVTHLFASEFVRTQATLAPLASSTHRTPAIVAARDAKGLLSALDSLPRGALALVAGHSNTVPALVERLSGGRAKPAIDDSEYDKLFIVVQWGEGRGEQLALELRY